MDYNALNMVGPSFEEIDMNELSLIDGGTSSFLLEVTAAGLYWTSLACAIGGSVTIISYTVLG